MHAEREHQSPLDTRPQGRVLHVTRGSSASRRIVGLEGHLEAGSEQLGALSCRYLERFLSGLIWFRRRGTRAPGRGLKRSCIPITHTSDLGKCLRWTAKPPPIPFASWVVPSVLGQHVEDASGR